MSKRVLPSVRGGDEVEVENVTVSSKALGQYTEIFGIAKKQEIANWVMGETNRLTRFNDDAPWFIWKSNGARFVFIWNEHVESNKWFILVTVEKE